MRAAPPTPSGGTGGGAWLLALLAGGQAVGDGLLALFQRLHDRRPHELHAEPHEQYEGDGLPDQGCVDIHSRTPELKLWNGSNYLPPTTANRMYMEIPTAIIGTASTRPMTMKNWVRRVGISSGWRATPSRKRPPRMPMPMAAPSAPRPIMMAPAI